jgi:hypothetical protein
MPAFFTTGGLTIAIKAEWHPILMQIHSRPEIGQISPCTQNLTGCTEKACLTVSESIDWGQQCQKNKWRRPGKNQELPWPLKD